MQLPFVDGIHLSTQGMDVSGGFPQRGLPRHRVQPASKIARLQHSRVPLDLSYRDCLRHWPGGWAVLCDCREETCEVPQVAVSPFLCFQMYWQPPYLKISLLNAFSQEQFISNSLVCVLPKGGFPCNCSKERGTKSAGDQTIQWNLNFIFLAQVLTLTQVWAVRGGSCYKLGSVEGEGVVRSGMWWCFSKNLTHSHVAREREAAMLSVYNQSYLAISVGEEVRAGHLDFETKLWLNQGQNLHLETFQVREVRLHKLGPDSVTWSYTLVLQPGPGPLGLQVIFEQYALLCFGEMYINKESQEVVNLWTIWSHLCNMLYYVLVKCTSI